LESVVLRRIFDPKRDEVTGEWRKLHSEELNGLYFLSKYYSADQIKKNKLEERREAYSVLVGKPKGRRSLGRLRRRWEDNIKMNLQDVDVGAWSGLIWLRIGVWWWAHLNAVKKLWVP
jgi:hypothetical protein